VNDWQLATTTKDSQMKSHQQNSYLTSAMRAEVDGQLKRPGRNANCHGLVSRRQLSRHYTVLCVKNATNKKQAQQPKNIG